MSVLNPNSVGSYSVTLLYTRIGVGPNRTGRTRGSGQEDKRKYGAVRTLGTGQEDKRKYGAVRTLGTGQEDQGMQGTGSTVGSSQEGQGIQGQERQEVQDWKEGQKGYKKQVQV